jgi:hypothetical protein
MGRMSLDRLGRGLGAGFAALALVLQILIPAGFMVTGAAAGPSLVICTGHGPWQGARPDHDKPGQAPSTGQDHVCVFAGHHGAAPAPTLAVLIVTPASYVTRPLAAVADLQPGRGLAAPPPPSHGPPSLSI